MIDYPLVFASAFLSATLLVFYSEAIVIYEVIQNPLAWIFIWLTATCGNTLGAVVNWLLGRYLIDYQNKRWFPLNSKQVDRARPWFTKYGIWSLLFSWAPLIGDALTLIAGLMRINIWLFIGLVALGKGLRYLFIIYIALNLTSQ